MPEVKYPSQHEAEFVCDYINALNGLHTGYAGDVGTDTVRAAMSIIQPQRERCFGQSSPWELYRKESRSQKNPATLAVRWNSDKAKHLGL